MLGQHCACGLGLGPKEYLEIPVGTNQVGNIAASHQKYLWWAQDV